MNTISTLPLSAQLDGLFGAGNCHPVACGRGDLRVVATEIFHRALIVVGFDYSIQHGSMGAREADQLVETLRRARQWSTPLVFLMNTSGVRVTEGTQGVAALRRILQSVLDARLEGIRMLAIIVRNCFGGASVLAALSERRIVNRDCLIAMSGPKLIEQASGSANLRAADTEAVRRLLGGETRSAMSPGFALVEDDIEAYRSALFDWLHQPASSAISDAILQQDRSRLRERLAHSGQPHRRTGQTAASLDGPGAAAISAVLGSGYEAQRWDQFVVAAHARNADSARVYGLVGGEAADAVHVLRLSEALSEVPAGTSAAVIVLDCESHSSRVEDEKVILSEYLAHLAIQARTLHWQGTEVRLIVAGVSGGGIFAALASAASKVCIVPGSRIRVLSKAAMAAINKSEGDQEGTPDRALQTGAVDEIMENLLERDSVGQQR